ncbi:hypothetical protein Scep_028905 [Stephania cephalantha]|uniref:Cystatin domain-containing protein n=1 Tax=Stephania cephalantha TaxID=152367 RepID=A0AAP0EF14_9MAGN
MFTPLLLLLSLLLFHTSFAQIRVGEFQPVDPKDPHVVEIARFAVDEHNKQAHTNLVFLEVFGAESQIVKGRNFKLTIRVANGTRRGFRTTHEALVYEGLKGQRTLKYFKAIPWVGGFQPIDPKDAHVIEVARFAVDAYNKQAHTNLGFLIVVEGESQVVVLGTNYNLTIRVYNGGLTQTYVIFVYEPLRGQKELKSFKIINGVRNKVGGFKLVDPRDPHIVEIGLFAVDQYNKQAHKSLVFKSVIQAQVQIVKGRNYKVTIRVADGGTYEALVYEALNGQKTLNGPLKEVVPIPGGYIPADPNDPHIVDTGRYAVDEYNKRTHMDLKFVNVIKAETQVVSGVNYRLVITARNKNDQVQPYVAVVLERAWESYRNLTNFNPLVQAAVGFRLGVYRLRVAYKPRFIVADERRGTSEAADARQQRWRRLSSGGRRDQQQCGAARRGDSGGGRLWKSSSGAAAEMAGRGGAARRRSWPAAAAIGRTAVINRLAAVGFRLGVYRLRVAYKVCGLELIELD